MKTFKDLEFKDHVVFKNGKQARMDNVSVIQGDGAYCDDDTYEVGVRDEDGSWDVEGHCDESRVEEILNGSPLNGDERSNPIDEIGHALRIELDAAAAGLKVLQEIEKKSRKRVMIWYNVSMFFHGGLALLYFYQALFTDLRTSPAIVGMWVVIVMFHVYQSNKYLNR